MFTRRLAPGTTPAAGRVRTFILHGEHWRFRPVSDATTSSMIAGAPPPLARAAGAGCAAGLDRTNRAVKLLIAAITRPVI